MSGWTAASALRWLCARRAPGPPPRTLLVVAHPDDETIGAGARLPRLSSECVLVHTTDGAPLDPGLSRPVSDPRRRAYAQRRRQELLAAMALAGIRPSQLRCLGPGRVCKPHSVAGLMPGRSGAPASAALRVAKRGAVPSGTRCEAPHCALRAGTNSSHPARSGVCRHALIDQESPFHLASLARALARLMDEYLPALVLTHPYEGGHPDHDAAAFGVHAAVALLRRAQRTPPVVLEMASYHSRDGALVVGEFVPAGGVLEKSVALSLAARRRKRQLFDCFASQRSVLSLFSLEREAFRAAPSYDFTQPPHPGALYYEQLVLRGKTSLPKSYVKTSPRLRHVRDGALFRVAVAKSKKADGDTFRAEHYCARSMEREKFGCASPRRVSLLFSSLLW